MDRQLQDRLCLFGQEGLAAPEIVEFVHTTLLWLERMAQRSCTEETAGPFASHLMLALERVRKGEELGSAWDAVVHEEAAEYAEQQPLQSWAEHIRRSAREVLKLSLPPEEYDFLLLHLASFSLRPN
jgi:hypothetical protein